MARDKHKSQGMRNKLLTTLALALTLATSTAAMADNPKSEDDMAELARLKEETARVKARRAIARLEKRATKAHESADRAAKRAKDADDKLSAAKSKAGKK